ncbi:hypothetical protein [Roseiflexus sp. RS-1]|jgi:hypothetical protein|uniref:hypothetical protein n=1 Tax=Roseiflexus sp. (strain RS-1) TaxID=357808 RepID=UPI0000D8287B|nr:hypothetical protein [Roseiflexus sp. RS-1]ABQ92394.1 hypothetical protein RoseRS_4050 [Roseiflexus sp. RS-1]
MPYPYELAQTYAPRPDFAERIATVAPTPVEFCRLAGLPYATYMRVLRTKRTSKRTALRIARVYALTHDHLTIREALDTLFEPRPRVVMEPVPGTNRYRRRADASSSGAHPAGNGCAAGE